MSKKCALVYCGARRGYEVLPVDPCLMTKETLVKGRISYVLNDVKTFPNVDINQQFGNVTEERTWVRFTFEVSAKADIKTLVHYAVGMDRFGGMPLKFSNHAGTMYISTCLCGMLGGASKFLLKAMHNEFFDLKKATVEFIDADGKRITRNVVWSRKDCEKFEKNTDVTHAVQALRKAYSKGKL